MTEAKGVIASVSTNPIKVIKALSQAYQIPDALPWSQIAGPLAAAEDSVARLDERLAKSPIRDGWAARTHFTEACATLWLEGELVHLDDLVLHDAGMDIRTPTHELTRAHAVLRGRRRILSQKPNWALGREGLRELTGRGHATSAAVGVGREGRGLEPAPLKPMFGMTLKTVFWMRSLPRSTLSWHGHQES